MKNRKSKVFIALLCVILCFGVFSLAACQTKLTPIKAEATVTSSEFDKSNPADVVFDITMNDATLIGVTLSGEDIGNIGYSFSAGKVTFKAAYLFSLTIGEKVFMFATNLNSIQLKITIKQTNTTPVAPDNSELMGDPYYNVGQGGVNTIIEPTDENWNNLKAKRAPLAPGEGFTENFGNAFSDSYLLPYKDDSFAPDMLGKSEATFAMVADDSNKAVRMTGIAEGDELYNTQSWAFIAFRGIRFTENAQYNIEITYTPKTPSARFQLCFDTPQNSLINLTGAVDVKTTASGKFTATTSQGYNGNTDSYLIVTFGGGKTSDTIDINKIKVTRLKECPSVANAQINTSVSAGFIAAGEATLSYTTNNTGNEKISWFISPEKNSLNSRTIIKEGLSDQVGIKSINVTSDMKGQYLGVTIRPDLSEDEYELKTTSIYVDSKIIDDVEFTNKNLSASGSYIYEDFTGMNTAENITFSTMSGADAFVKAAPSGMSGQALFIDISGQSSYAGAKFDGFELAPSMVYKLSFKVMFKVNVADNLTIKLRPGDEYWNDIQLDFDTSGKAVNTVYNFESAPVKLGDSANYKILMHNYVNATTVIIDDMRIEKIEPKVLAKAGDKATLNFDDKHEIFAANSNKDLASDISLVDGTALGMSGNALKITPTKTDVSGVTLSGITIAPNLKYKLSFKLYVVSETDLGGQFLVKFIAADGSAIQDMQYTSSVNKNELTSFKTAAVTLDGKSYQSIDVLNYYAGYTMYIDDIVLEVLP